MTALLKRTVFIFALILLALNFIAYRHAVSMSYFSVSGERTRPPEQLTLLGKIYTVFFGVTVPRPNLSDHPSKYALNYTTHKFHSRDDLELEAWHIPYQDSTKTIVLFHGYATTKSSLLKSAALFHELGYSCFLVDFYGSGGSTGASTSIGYYEAEDIEHTLTYVRTKWPSDNFVLYATSMGSAAVLKAAASSDIQVEALILESPFDSLLHTVGNRFNAMGLPAIGLAELLVFWGGAVQGYDAMSFQPAEYAKAVQIPTLLMYGSKDPRVKPLERQRLYQNLAGLKVYREFENASHELLSVRNPNAWTAEVKSFLNKVEQSQ